MALDVNDTSIGRVAHYWHDQHKHPGDVNDCAHFECRMMQEKNRILEGLAAVDLQMKLMHLADLTRQREMYEAVIQSLQLAMKKK